MEGSAGNDYNDARQESADVEAVGDTVNVDASVLDDAVNKNKYKRSKHKCPFVACVAGHAFMSCKVLSGME